MNLDEAKIIEGRLELAVSHMEQGDIEAALYHLAELKNDVDQWIKNHPSMSTIKALMDERDRFIQYRNDAVRNRDFGSAFMNDCMVKAFNSAMDEIDHYSESQFKENREEKK